MYLLRDKFLNTTSFLMSPDNENGALTPQQIAAKARENIEVNVSDASKTPEQIAAENSGDDKDENDEDKDEDENEDDKTDKDEDNENDDNKKDDEDKDEDDETEEQKKARIAKAKEDRKSQRQQKRIDKAIAEAKEAKEELARLQQQLNEKPVEGLTEEEVERRAELKASEKLLAKQNADAQKEFNNNCDKLETAAVKINKDFVKNLNEMVEELGPVPSPIIFVLADLDNENGGEVLNYLADNVDEAEDIYTMSQHRMTQKLLRISDKLKDAKKVPPKQRSNNPPPINPIRESNRTEITTLTGKEDQETFNRIRAKQEKAKREQRGY